MDLAKRMEMPVIDIYFQKTKEHRVTYKLDSVGRCTQVDYILYRRCNLKEVICKVVAGETAARHHWMVVCRKTESKNRKRLRTEPKTKECNLKKEDCCSLYRKKLRLALGGSEELPDDWGSIAE